MAVPVGNTLVTPICILYKTVDTTMSMEHKLNKTTGKEVSELIVKWQKTMNVVVSL